MLIALQRVNHEWDDEKQEYDQWESAGESLIDPANVLAVATRDSGTVAVSSVRFGDFSENVFGTPREVAAKLGIEVQD